ncbi:hypothetical protein HDU83_005384, partial [Entophlyctis luteolus]
MEFRLWAQLQPPKTKARGLDAQEARQRDLLQRVRNGASSESTVSGDGRAPRVPLIIGQGSTVNSQAREGVSGASTGASYVVALEGGEGPSIDGIGLSRDAAQFEVDDEDGA